MSELRDPTTDGPDDQPAKTPGQIDVGRIKELNALGDAKAFDPRTSSYDPLEHVRPRDSREDAVETGGVERPGLLSLSDKVRAASDERFARSDAEALVDEVEPEGAAGLERLDDPPDPAEDRSPEVLHAFGNKDRPRPVRLENDLKLTSWDEMVTTYAPTSPTDKVRGASTFIDPLHPEVPMSGKYHRLPTGYQPSEESGLAIHADGKDVHPDAPNRWGHRTIYATVPMTAAEFNDRVAALPWEYAGNRRDRT